jgi:hypothetical protein
MSRDEWHALKSAHDANFSRAAAGLKGVANVAARPITELGATASDLYGQARLAFFVLSQPDPHEADLQKRVRRATTLPLGLHGRKSADFRPSHPTHTQSCSTPQCFPHFGQSQS